MVAVLVTSCGRSLVTDAGADDARDADTVNQSDPLEAPGESDAGEAPDTVTPTLEGLGLGMYPLDTLFDGVDDLAARIDVAMDSLIATCMAGRGFVYEPTPFPGPGRLGPPAVALDDPAAAAESGYLYDHSSGDEGSQLNPGAEGLSPGELTAWSDALFGTETAVIPGTDSELSVGGCLDEAETVIFGDRLQRHGLVLQIVDLRNQASLAVSMDEAMVIATSAWSACMSSRGFAVESPLEARELAFNESDDTAIAVAEAECAADTGLNDEFRETVARQQSALAAANLDLIAIWLEQVASEIAAAASVVVDTSGN